MKYDDIPVCKSEASENEWLDVKFSHTKKLDESTQNMLQNDNDENESEESAFGKIKNLFKRRPKHIVEDESCDEIPTPLPEVTEDVEQNDAVPEIRKRVKYHRSGRIRAGTKTLWQKCWKPVAACAIIGVALVGMKFADVGFVGDVFEYAKMTYTSTISNATDFAETSSIMVPATATIAVKDGDITLTGGKLVLNLKEGKVTNIGENSVTVNVGDKFDIVYTNITETMVKKDDVLSQFQVIGKYTENTIVNLLIDGQKVVNVTVDGYTLKWQV